MSSRHGGRFRFAPAAGAGRPRGAPRSSIERLSDEVGPQALRMDDATLPLEDATQAGIPGGRARRRHVEREIGALS